MRLILSLCLILSLASAANAGNRFNNQRQRDFNAGVRAAQGNGHCGNNQFRNFNRFNGTGNFGGTTFIRERSIGPFGIFGTSRTVISR